MYVCVLPKMLTTRTQSLAQDPPSPPLGSKEKRSVEKKHNLVGKTEPLPEMRAHPAQDRAQNPCAPLSPLAWHRKLFSGEKNTT